MYIINSAFIKNIAKRLIGCNKNETGSEFVDKKLARIKRKFDKRILERALFCKTIRSLGVVAGDILIVHCAWRYVYAYQGTPKDMIEDIISVIGDEGTLLMPCYGKSMHQFDMSEPSRGGVLSEIFRLYPKVIRSECSHWSMVAYGKEAINLTKEHRHSCYGLDLHSPYYLASVRDNAKIMMIGMGKYPYRLTLVHLPEFLYKDKFEYFHKYLDQNYTANIIQENGATQTREMIKASSHGFLHRTRIKNLYKMIPEHTDFSNCCGLTIRVIKAKPALNYICNYIENEHKSFLTTPKTDLHSFDPPITHE